jgi:hypothetical protein
MTEALLSIYQFSGNMKGLQLIMLFGRYDEQRYRSVI